MERTYIAIDLKSFYASVECVERGLDPLKTNLVVADESRTEKTICLAVSPPLKAYGISGRARLFEVVQRVREVNRERRNNAHHHEFSAESYLDDELKQNNNLALGYIVAPPRMAYYMQYSTKIYQIYLKYVAPEDIHVYSIDEVFMDVTHYLSSSNMTAHEFAMKIILDVLSQTGITATAGIGTNMFLSKIAMDIGAKHIQPDENGVRIAKLDEMTYRQLLWSHRPLTDFWRVGGGYAKKLEQNGMFTMGDIARRSLTTEGENLLYKLFGVNAELLIDHAWGYEPCTINEIKQYKPTTNSISSGQVLTHAYDADKARLVASEMADLLALDLVDKKLVTDQIVLTVGYDIENLSDIERASRYYGEVTTDRYGRAVPKSAHGTVNLSRQCASAKIIVNAVCELFDKIVDKNLLIRRLNITAGRVVNESEAENALQFEQLDFFTNYEALDEKRKREETELEKEKKIQNTVVSLKKRYGKNAVLKGMNLKEGATAKERNSQIGGHKA